MTSGEPAALNLGQFSNLDASKSAASLLDDLDRRDRLPSSIAVRARLYEMLEAQAGERIADVGCGTGKVVADLIEGGVDATGVDVSQQAITRAIARFPGADFRVASAEALPLRDGELAGYTAVQVYSHLPDPGAALAEARRVLRGDGRLVLVDLENDLWAIDSDDELIVRKMLPAFADTVANPWIGRRFRSLLLDAGFSDVIIEARSIVLTEYGDIAPAIKAIASAATAANAVTSSEADLWLAEQVHRGEHGRFFAAIPAFYARARKRG